MNAWMHQCTHTVAPAPLCTISRFKPASGAVSLLHGQWRRRASPHMVQSSPGIHHCPSAIVQSVLKHHSVGFNENDVMLLKLQWPAQHIFKPFRE